MARTADAKKAKKQRKNTKVKLDEWMLKQPLLDALNSEHAGEKARAFAFYVLCHCQPVVDRPDIIQLKGVTYVQGSKVDYGRLYASSPSLQTCPGWLRRLCCHGLYFDHDMVNAFPTIFAQIAGKAGIETPNLTNYVKDRKAVIEGICADLSLSYEQVKAAFLTALHHGNYRQHTNWQLDPVLDAFSEEIRRVAKALHTLPDYAPKWADAAGRPNPIGTFVSRVCQVVENDLVLAAMEYNTSQGLDSRVLIFDGLQSLKPIDLQHEVFVDPEAYLRKVGDFALEKTGFQVTFCEKSLEPRPEDRARLGLGAAVPAVVPISIGKLGAVTTSSLDQLDPKQKLFLFDYDGTLGSTTHLRPGIESLKRLQKAGYAIGIWASSAREELTPRLRDMAAVHGLHFKVVLDKTDCEAHAAPSNTPPCRAQHPEPSESPSGLVKPIRKRFPAADGWRVVLVDDTPTNVPPEDRHLLRKITTWTPDPKYKADRLLPELVQRLLVEDRAAHPANQSARGLATTSIRTKSRFEDAKEINLEDMPFRDETDHAKGRRMHDIVFEAGVKLVMLIAAMGLGKSHTCKAYLKQLMGKITRAGRSPRILFLTTRRQQAQTLLGGLHGLDFKLYSDVEGCLGGVDRLVLQYESLHRLMPKLKGEVLKSYDLIVLDEARGICGQACSKKTNGCNMGGNAAIFKAVLLRARKCLMMDADIETDGMVRGLVSEIWKDGSERRVYRYTHVPLTRKIAIVTDAVWRACVKRDIEAGEKVGIVFRSKNVMNDWLTVAGQKRSERSEPLEGPFTCVAIDSESTPEQMAIFQNIDAALKDVQVFCFTSKVTTAADIQLMFDRVYVHGGTQSAQGPTAREVYQMTGRFRNLKDSTVVVVFPAHSHSTDREILHPSEVNRLDNQETDRHLYLHRLEETMGPDGIKGMKWSESWLLILAGWDSTERREDFRTAFTRVTMDKGYVFTSGPDLELGGGDDVQADLKTAKGERKKEKKALQLRTLGQLQQLDTAKELKDAAYELKNKNNPTREEREKMEQLRVLEHFPAHFKEMKMKDVSYARNHMRALELAKQLELRPPSDPESDSSSGGVNPENTLMRRDGHRLQNGSLPEVAPINLPALEEIEKALLLVGFTGISDYTTEVSADAMSDHADPGVKRAVVEACDQATRHGDRRSRCSTILGSIKRELETWGHHLVKRRWMAKGARQTGYTIARSEHLQKLLPQFKLNESPERPVWPSAFIGLSGQPAPASELSQRLRPAPDVDASKKRNPKRKLPDPVSAERVHELDSRRKEAGMAPMPIPPSVPLSFRASPPIIALPPSVSPATERTNPSRDRAARKRKAKVAKLDRERDPVKKRRTAYYEARPPPQAPPEDQGPPIAPTAVSPLGSCPRPVSGLLPFLRKGCTASNWAYFVIPAERHIARKGPETERARAFLIEVARVTVVRPSSTACVGGDATTRTP